MADAELSKLLENAISLTQWFHKIDHKDFETLRDGDGNKRPRLGVLNKIIGLPFDNPEYFDATEITLDNSRFKKIMDTRAEETCAYRLIPRKDNLPILRMRGKSIRETFEWFKQQDIDHALYKVEVIPHNERYNWSTIFIVNQHGVFGEIIDGGLHLLSHGHHGAKKPIVFNFDFKDWKLSKGNPEALAHLKTLVTRLHVSDKTKQAHLHEELGSTFAHDYLTGYFETIDSEVGTWFCDYSIRIGEIYGDVIPTLSANTTGLLEGGQTGSGGKAEGVVKKVTLDDISSSEVDFPEGAILVSSVTSPEFLPYMQKAAAIVTDQGGILSHAAIVSRELGVPCVVGTGNATEVLQDGMHIQVDADNARVLLVG